MWLFLKIKYVPLKVGVCWEDFGQSDHVQGTLPLFHQLEDAKRVAFLQGN